MIKLATLDMIGNLSACISATVLNTPMSILLIGLSMENLSGNRNIFEIYLKG